MPIPGGETGGELGNFLIVGVYHEVKYFLSNVFFESDVLEIAPFRGYCDHAAKQNILATLWNFSSWSMGLCWSSSPTKLEIFPLL